MTSPPRARAAAPLCAALLLAVPLFAAGAAAQPSLVAEACVACHGPRGTGSGSIPALAGRDRAELGAAIAAFRTNGRPATIMNRLVRGYTDAELAAALDHFAAEAPAP